MSSVKKRRHYNSPRRDAQAETTRQAVLAAARELFIASGWAGATIAAVARAASVSPETIYATFGSKQEVLRAVIAGAVRGGAPDVPLLDQQRTRAVLAEADPRRLIADFADEITTILARVAPLVAVVRTASESDAKMAALYAELHDGRRQNLAVVAEALATTGSLRSGMDAPAATAIIWRLASPELFLLARNHEDLSQDAYSKWLADSLAVLLLAD